MNTDLHFSSKSDTWETPQWLFDELDAEFSFELDVCATPENAKCQRFYTIEDDGLVQTWTGTAWMNPPYGRTIKHWIQKAYESRETATTVCLLPSRTDTRYFHQYIWNKEYNCPRIGVEIRFLPGRLKFGNAENAAPFPSMIVVFKKKLGKQY